MINWFDMPAEGLSNGGLFEVKELEVTENGTYETKGEMYNKVTVNVEGGGGSSDFSTAEVHLVCAESDIYLTFVGKVWNEEHQTNIVQALMPSGTLWADEYEFISPFDESIDFMMLDSSFKLSSSADTMTVTGNATVVHDEDMRWIATVTGDCTITISAGE